MRAEEVEPTHPQSAATVNGTVEGATRTAARERDLDHAQAKLLLTSQGILFLVAFGLSLVARFVGVMDAKTADQTIVAIGIMGGFTATGGLLLRARVSPSGVAVGVLLAVAVVGYPVVFLSGGAPYPMGGAVLVTLIMVPIFAGRRFAIPMAGVHWLLFTGLLYLDGIGVLDSGLPDRVQPLPSSGPAAQAWVAFSVACLAIPALLGRVPIDLQKSEAALAEEVQQRTSALERTSARLVVANGELTALNAELGETITQLGVVNDALGQSNAELGRANGELEQANRDLAEANLELAQVNQELEAANAALQRSNERLDQFNTAVSHDLRAPLQAITARAELAALAAHNDPARVSRMADQICDSAARMACQLDELHKLSRVGDRLDSVEQVHLGGLLGEIVHELDPRIRERRVHLEVVHPLPSVTGNRALLSELFQNLLDNAVKYGKPGAPRVRVAAAEAPDGWVAASVEDNGRGIPAEERARVFELFQRLPRDRQEEGLGAGLSIVRRIADVHGGSVVVTEGEHLSGARFVVRLPGAEAADRTSAETYAGVSGGEVAEA